MDQDSQQNPSSYFTIFKVSLARDQQKALSLLLPHGYSFQPYKTTRSLDQESLKSQPKNPKKKQNPTLIKEQKDPDYSASYIPVSKQQKAPKVQSLQSIPGGQPFMQCYLILKKLKKSLYAWPFKQPVDPKALGIPQYFNIVLEPMDLKKIEDNLRKQAYKHPAQFHRDMYKIMMNSYKFNQKNSDVFEATKQFQQEYLKYTKESKEEKIIRPKLQQSAESPTVRQKSQAQPSAPIVKQIRLQSKKQRLQKPQKTQKPDKPQKAQKVQKNEKIQKIQKQPQIKSNKQKQKEKQKDEPQKLKHEQNDKSKSKYNTFIENDFKHQTSAPHLKHQDNYLLLDQFLIPHSNKQYKQEHKEPKQQDFIENSNQPTHMKKTKSKIIKQSKNKEKKQKKNQPPQSPSELKDPKQSTQLQNEKTIVFNQIKNRLTDLLKKLNDYQMPSKMKNKQSCKVTEGFQHPNFNNFTTITAAEKKKLAEKISALPPHQLRYVLEICFRNKRSKTREDEGNYEIDLQKIDAKTLKQLSNFVSMRVKKLKKQTSKSKQDNKVHIEQEVIEDHQIDHIEGREEQEIQQDHLHLDHQDSQRSRSYDNLFLGDHHFGQPYHHRDRDVFGTQFGQFKLIDSDDPPNNHDDQYSMNLGYE